MAWLGFPVFSGWRLKLFCIAVALLLAVSAATGLADRVVDAYVRPASPQQARALIAHAQEGAGAAFLTVRTLGRVVAVASSTTVNGSVGAVVSGGASLEVGNVLTPFEQLLDVLGDVLMASFVTLTIQLVLVDVFDAFALRWMLPAGLGLLAIALAVNAAPKRNIWRLSYMLIAGAVLAKLIVPLSVHATASLAGRFLAEHAKKAEQVLKMTSTEPAKGMPQTEEEPGKPWYSPGRLAEMLGALAPSKVAASVERAVDASLTWMAVFVLQTDLFPLGVAAFLIWLFRLALRRPRGPWPA